MIFVILFNAFFQDSFIIDYQDIFFYFKIENILVLGMKNRYINICKYLEDYNNVLRQNILYMLNNNMKSDLEILIKILNI